MTGTNITRWGGFSTDALDKLDEQIQDIAGNVYLDLEPGENIVRFLPPIMGRESPFRVTAQHYIDAIPGFDRMFVFACPRVELKQPCLACQKCEELNKTGNPVDRERAFKMSAGLRVFANVIDRKHPDRGVKVLGFGKMIWEQLKTIRKNARLGGDFTDPSAGGFDIIITREGEGRSTKYQCAADRTSSPLAPTDEEIEAILGMGHDLDALVNPAIPEELIGVWGRDIQRMVSPAAAVAAQRPVQTGFRGTPAQTAPASQQLPARSTATVLPTSQVPAAAQPVGAGLMGRHAQPAQSAVQDAEDSSWLDD